MGKLLFVAGEPGSGKSTHVACPLHKKDLALKIGTDAISARAAEHYKKSKQLGCKWMLWKVEFDEEENYEDLLVAYLKSMQEREGVPLSEANHVVCEGALSGHPAFRELMKAVLPDVGFQISETLEIGINSPWKVIAAQLKKRGRQEDQNLELTRPRSKDYKERLQQQVDLNLYPSSEECFEAARRFLSE